MAAWILGIDFGTSYTTAAARVDDRAEIIEVDGDRRVPSIILLGQGDDLVVGKAAENQAPLYPNRIVREPKRLLGEPAPVIVGGKPYPVTRLVGAVLDHVYRRAVEHQGAPPAEVRLTHPASWRRPRVKALGEAAALAGIATPRFIPEPVAAAIAYGTEGGSIPEGAHVAIYDLGGGTFDTAVLRAVGSEFEVVGRPGGDPRLGGEFFDELLANHLGSRLPPSTWDSLQVSDELVWRQAHAAFRTEVRKAKEALSLQPLAELLVALPAGLERLAISREEFEILVRPHLVETTDMLRTTIADAGVTDPDLAAIYMVGGASRIPLAERLLRDAFPNVPVSRRGDPKMVVALGATHASAIGTAIPVVTPPTVTAPTGAAAAGVAPHPVAATSVGSADVGSPLDRTHHDPGPQPPAASPPPHRRRFAPTVAVAIGLAIAAAAAASVAAFVILSGDSPRSAVGESATPRVERSTEPSPSRSERASSTPSATPTATVSTQSSAPAIAATVLPATPRPATPRPATPRPATPPPAAPVATPVPVTPAPQPPQPVAASMISPPAGSKLSGTSVTFTWTPVANARYYSLWIGSQPPPDPNDAFAHRDYGEASGMPPSQTSATMSGLPSNGATVYVRLFTKIEPESGPLLWRDYTYTAAGG